MNPFALVEQQLVAVAPWLPPEVVVVAIIVMKIL